MNTSNTITSSSITNDINQIAIRFDNTENATAYVKAAVSFGNDTITNNTHIHTDTYTTYRHRVF